MGKLYENGYNPFQDYLMELLLNGVDISDLNIRNNIESVFIYILEMYLNNKKDVVYLDFDIIKDDITFDLIPNNIISALWFSGILPEDADIVIRDGFYEYDGVKYIYDDLEHKILTK